MDKVDARSNSSYLTHPFSGYFGLFFLILFLVQDNDFVTSI
jgi:hypothetical protein